LQLFIEKASYVCGNYRPWFEGFFWNSICWGGAIVSQRLRAPSCSLSSEERAVSAATIALGLKGHSGAVFAGAALLCRSASSEERIISVAGAVMSQRYIGGAYYFGSRRYCVECRGISWLLEEYHGWPRSTNMAPRRRISRLAALERY
jgi:hypothetical protein